MDDVESDLVASARKAEAFYMEKLAAVRQVLATFGAAPDVAGDSAGRPSAAKPAKTSKSPASKRDKFGAYGQMIIDAALPLLPDEDKRPLPTRELLEKLEFREIEVRGENKINALSALLARSSQVKGHGRSGWTIYGSQTDRQVKEIVGGDAQKENEPTSGYAVGSDADHSPVRTGPVITGSTQSWPSITS